MIWKIHDVCLVDNLYRVKIKRRIRGGREFMVQYHKPAENHGMLLGIVNINRLSALPANNQP